jgi:hypothetical protein
LKKLDLKKLAKTTTLLIIFTTLTILSIATVYVTHQAPTEEPTTNTLCTYTSLANYNYTATLDPNTIYNNKTTLKQNEGTLYTQITNKIDLTLTYAFATSIPTETPTITYLTSQTLKTNAVQYEIARTTLTTTNQTTIRIDLPSIIVAELETIKRTLETETGTSSSTYTLEISPTFTTDANTNVGQIHQTFAPTLTIDFERTDQGDIITITELHQTKPGAITENQTITRYDILNQRGVSYILIVLSIAGLGFSTYFYMKTKPKQTTIPLEKLTAPYKDLIIEAQTPPQTLPGTTIIAVTTIQELAKTAEILAKPMILTKEPKPTLTIIDQNTIYQHTP